MTRDPITGEVHVSDLEREQDIEDEMADRWIDQQVDREEWITWNKPPNADISDRR